MMAAPGSCDAVPGAVVVGKTYDLVLWILPECGRWPSASTSSSASTVRTGSLAADRTLKALVIVGIETGRAEHL